MKSYLPLIAFAALLASCSSVYKSGQTPDDVYFSPERPRDEYVRVDERTERRYEQDDEASREDRYLRMKTRNRRYGLLEDDYYAYNGPGYYRYNDYYQMNSFRYSPNWWTWNYRFGGHFNDPFFHNPYYFNPYFHSPYYSGIVYGNVRPVYNKPRTTNLAVYDRDGNYNGTMQRSNNRRYDGGSNRNNNYRGSGTNAGGFLRDVFGGGNSNSGTSNKTNASSGSTNSGSSNSGSSGSSRAPVRKF